MRNPAESGGKRIPSPFLILRIITLNLKKKYQPLSNSREYLTMINIIESDIIMGIITVTLEEGGNYVKRKG